MSDFGCEGANELEPTIDLHTRQLFLSSMGRCPNSLTLSPFLEGFEFVILVLVY